MHRRYVVSGRRQYDWRAMRGHEYIRHDEKAASRLAPKGDDGRFDFSVTTNGCNDRHDLERLGRRLKCGHITDAGAVSGLNMIAARFRPGAVSESSSSHLPPSVAS